MPADGRTMERVEGSDFAGLLRHFRAAAGLTQEKLAEAAQLSPKAISSLERGIRTRPHRATIELLAGALELGDADRQRLTAAARGGARAVEPRQSMPVGAFLGAAPADRMVARGPELATLNSLLEESASGSGRLVVLVGEAGVGKTRLGQEVSLSMLDHGFLTVAGRCYEPNSAVPYFPFLETLAGLIAGSPEALRSDIPARWPQLGLLLPELETVSGLAQLGGPDEQSLIFRSVAGFIADAAEHNAIGILLDDLHWADDSSLRLLHHLARAVRGDRVFILGTYRDLEVGRTHPLTSVLHNLEREGLLSVVRVDCLDRDGTLELIEDITAETPLAQQVEDSVYRRAEGNPYFIRQLVDAITQPPAHRAGSDAVDVPVPSGIRSIISQRLNRLDTGTQDILTDAAVLGQTFLFEDLQESSERLEIDVEKALEAAAGVGIVRETGDDTFEFDHAITQQTLYEDIPARRRKRMHIKAGQVIDDSTDQRLKPRAAEIAWHFVQGGDEQNALQWSMTAGQQAWKVAALTEVEYHYRTALALAVQLNDSARDAQAREGLGRLYHVLARHDEARDTLQAADLLYESIGDNIGRGRLAIDLGAVYFMEGSPEPGIQCIEEALQRLGDAPLEPDLPSPIPELYVTLGDFLWPMGRREEALAANSKAVETSRAANDARMRVLADMQRVRFLESLGQRRDALQTAEASLPHIRSLGDSVLLWYALQVLTAMYWIRGRLDDSFRVIGEALAIAIQTGDAEYIAGSKALLGRYHAWTGDWPEARRLLDEAASESAIGDLVLQFIMCLRAELRLWQGDWEQMLIELATVLEAAEASGNVDRISMATHLLAEHAIRTGRPENALESLEALRQRSGFHADHPDHSAIMAMTFSALGRNEEAWLILEPAIATARADDLTLPLLDLLRLQGQLLTERGEYESAGPCLREAICLSNAAPAPMREAQATLELARLQAAAGHNAEATETFTAALGAFTRLGSQMSVAMVEEEMARHKAPVSGR